MSDPDKQCATDPRCTLLDSDKLGPFVELDDGRILTVTDNAIQVSVDRGSTWSDPQPIYTGAGPGKPSSSGLLARAPDGAIVFVYMDLENFRWSWDETAREADPDVSLDVWTVRSPDQGRTWTAPQKITAGYCGALIDMIATRSGALVVPIQRLVRDPSRHAICVYVSADSGQTWRPSNVIDLGGHGHHDGAIEPTLVELEDGRLWMLIRTNLDYFWEAYSDDKGRSWRVLRPTVIDASSAPAYLLRLASGRLVMVWNRLRSADGATCPRRGGDCQLGEPVASWYREELSLAFSADDGRTWTDPAVILQVKGGGPSYPYIFEPEPGRLWVSTRFGDRMIMSLREADFVDA